MRNTQIDWLQLILDINNTNENSKKAPFNEMQQQWDDWDKNLKAGFCLKQYLKTNSLKPKIWQHELTNTNYNEPYPFSSSK